MKTSYSFGGNIYRYQGIYSAICILAISFLLTPSHKLPPEVLILLILSLLWGIINLWFIPIANIDSDKIYIRRLFFFKQDIYWADIVLYKKVRRITHLGLIGLDKRYSMVFVKNRGILLNRFYVLPFFKYYDTFIQQIEEHIGKANIRKVEGYRNPI